MKHHPLLAIAARALFVVATAAAALSPAYAARVGVLSNRYATETAADFNTRISSHVFTAVDTSASVPSLSDLTSAYDVLLVFEDLTYGNSTAVGNVVSSYAQSGRAVVIGAFYDQDRSDGPVVNTPHGWGALETLDPNTTDGTGTPYAPRTLNATNLVVHPLTTGLTSLTSAQFAGGNNPKPGTTVVAWWNQPNALGKPDPAIAYRITGVACVIQVAIAPDYPSTKSVVNDFSGDFYPAWKNAFDFAVAKCVVPAAIDPPGALPAPIPTLSQLGLILTILLVGVVGLLSRRKKTA